MPRPPFLNAAHSFFWADPFKQALRWGFASWQPDDLPPKPDLEHSILGAAEESNPLTYTNALEKPVLEGWLGSFRKTIDSQGSLDFADRLEHNGKETWNHARTHFVEKSGLLRTLREAAVLALAPSLLGTAFGRNVLQWMLPASSGPHTWIGEFEEYYKRHHLPSRRERIGRSLAGLVVGPALALGYLAHRSARWITDLSVTSYLAVTDEDGFRWYHSLALPFVFVWHLVVHSLGGELIKALGALVFLPLSAGMRLTAAIHRRPRVERSLAIGGLIGGLVLIASTMLAPSVPGFLLFTLPIQWLATFMPIPMAATVVAVLGAMLTLGCVGLILPRRLTRGPSKPSSSVLLVRFALPLLLAFPVSWMLMQSIPSWSSALNQVMIGGFSPIMLMALLGCALTVLGCHIGAHVMHKRQQRRQGGGLGDAAAAAARPAHLSPTLPPAAATLRGASPPSTRQASAAAAGNGGGAAGGEAAAAAAPLPPLPPSSPEGTASPSGRARRTGRDAGGHGAAARRVRAKAGGKAAGGATGGGATGGGAAGCAAGGGATGGGDGGGRRALAGGGRGRPMSGLRTGDADFLASLDGQTHRIGGDGPGSGGSL